MYAESSLPRSAGESESREPWVERMAQHLPLAAHGAHPGRRLLGAVPFRVAIVVAVVVLVAELVVCLGPTVACRG